MGQTEHVSDIRVEWPRRDVACIVVSGEHDLGGIERIDRAAILVAGAVTQLVVDLSAADFLDSTLLNAVSRVQRVASEAGLRFNVVIGDNRIVHRTLEVTAMLEPLNAVPTLAEALGNSGL